MRHILGVAQAGLLERFAWSRVLLAFDFDGTLAPIVARPDAARLRERTYGLLERLCHLYPCAIISVRSRADVERRLNGLPFRKVVGNHGLEPGARLARFARAVASIREQLEGELRDLAGVDIEDKQFSLAVHYRRSRSKRKVRELLRKIVAGLEAPARAIPGKLVVNLVPAGAPHKGDALTVLRDAQGLDTAIYAGDDVTDEDVFALDQPGRLLAIRVGLSKGSAAPYYLRDQREMDRLLARLVALRDGG